MGPVPGVDVMAKRSQGWAKCEDRLPHCPEITEEEEKELSACRGEGSAAGPLRAARALPLRCAAGAMLRSALAVPNCGAQGAPAV